MSQGTGLGTGHSGFSKCDSAELELPGNEVERDNLGSQGLVSLKEKKDQKQAVTVEADGKAQHLECQHGHELLCILRQVPFPEPSGSCSEGWGLDWASQKVLSSTTATPA